MAWSGGVFTRQITALSLSGSTIWASVAALGRKIRTDDHDNNDTDLANGINACLVKDGTNAATGNLDLGGYVYTNASTTVSARHNLVPVAVLQDGDVVYAGLATGTANALTLTLSPAVTALVDGMQVRFRAASSNTSSTVTANLNTLGNTNIVNADGSALVAGNIKSGGLYQITYSSGDTSWHLMNVASITVVTVSDKTSAYTMQATDLGSIVENTGATSYAINLMVTSSAGTGYNAVLANNGASGTTTVTPAVNELIAGLTTFNLLPFQSIRYATANSANMIISATPWGDMNGMEQYRPKFRAYREAFNSTTLSMATTHTIDLSISQNYKLTLGASVTLAFTNPPPSGSTGGATLLIIQGASNYGITWPAAIKWPSSTAPTLTSTSGRGDLIIVQTNDGGTTYGGITAAQNFNGWA